MVIEGKEKRKIFVVAVVLFAILFFGVFMRLWQLGYSSYWLDEGFTLMQARGISIHGYPLLDSGYTEWKDSLMPYITAPLVKIFGFENAWMLRLPSAIFGILTILIGYYLAVNIFSYYTGLLFAFFIASCHWYIAWSQQARGYSALIFFVLLFFYFLSKYEQKIKKSYLWYAFLTIIIGIMAKKAAIVLFIPFLFYLIGKKIYKTFFIFAFFGIIIGIFFVSEVQNVITLNPVEYFGFYIKGYLVDYFGIFVVLALFGGVVIVWNNQKQRVLHGSIALFVIGAVIIFAGFVSISEKRYLLFVTPFFFLYTSYFIEYLSTKLKHQFVIGVILFAGVVIISESFNYSTVLIPRKHYELEYYTPQPNYKKVYNKIQQNGFNENDTIVSTNPLMDIIYLGQANYAIPWSLTGKKGDTTFIGGRDIYSGAKELRSNNGMVGLDMITRLQKKGNVYVVMDSLSSRRMEFDIWDDITDMGKELFRDGKEHMVKVYLFPKENIVE